MTQSDPETAFELKGSMFTLTIIQLYASQLELITQRLDQKIAQAPGFFKDTPVVIDLSELVATPPLDFVALINTLRVRSMIPIGIRNGSEQLQMQARAAGLPILVDTPAIRAEPATRPSSTQAAPQTDNKPVEEKADTTPAVTTSSPSRLLTQPVRSGQQIYAAGGDLIVLGSVSNGAEVLADGNIHIYGSLRGRALAGIKGDHQARIFCNSLEAQLISVAGNYRILDEPEKSSKNKPVQIFLNNEKLVVESLGR